jgi:predicted AlkP superfamily pyrophosphatase or phosphodiesterase
MTTPRSRRSLHLFGLVVLSAVALTAPHQPAVAQTPTPPKLVVLLVVDQMRADYLDWYGAHFTEGFRRLTREGAVFERGAYPYLNTITCAGHATIGTGSYPYRHGMILNNWFDRATGKSPYCTDDPDMTEISYNGLASVQGDSAKRLLVPAIGEQILNRGGRSVAFSLKPRSAVTLTGHKSTAVVWFDDRGGWTTSTAFTSGPVPFVREFVESNPITADFDKVWDRMLPLTAYQGEDDVASEGTVAGWSRAFPHALGLVNGKADSQFYGRWQRSPYADEYVARMAMASVDALNLGRGNNTDFLGVSFSAVDGAGHVFGPRSHEIQDMLVRLDRTIGRLLAHLDATVGAGNYVVGLSADHGVAEIPEQSGTGRVLSRTVTETLQKVLVPAMGPGTHVASSAYTNVYLTEAARARLTSDKTLRRAAIEALQSIEGIKHAFWGPDLATEEARRSRDQVRRAAALSHHPDRSGDLIIAPAEKWILSSSVTTHGSHYSYDQRVPVVLFGASVRPGRYQADATPADLAPSLAAIAKIAIAPTDGRVLKEALIAR